MEGLKIGYSHKKLIRKFLKPFELDAINAECSDPINVAYQIAVSRQTARRSDVRFRSHHISKPSLDHKEAPATNGHGIGDRLKRIGLNEIEGNIVTMYTQGYGLQEISDMTGVSYSTTKRAMAKCRELAAEQAEIDGLVDCLFKRTNRLCEEQ